MGSEVAVFEQCTLSDVSDALSYLDYDDRDTWVSMAFAIKNEFGSAGFDEWDRWSAQSDKYKQKDARAVWRSAKTSGRSGAITIATLFKLAIDLGYKPRAVSDEERERLKRVQQERARQRAIEEKQEQARIAKLHAAVSEAAEKLLGYTGTVGKSKYLGLKGVGSHGLRFFKRSVLIVTDEDTAEIRIEDDRDKINEFLKTVDADKVSFKHLRPGVIAVPMYDELYKLTNLQLIFASGKKSFLKGGRKQGCFFHIGEEVKSTLLITEGYATGASLHEATGLPVVVAFDAGNLLPVAEHLRMGMPDALFVFAGDDDWETEGNPGKAKAEAAAVKVGGVTVYPKFLARVAA